MASSREKMTTMWGRASLVIVLIVSGGGVPADETPGAELASLIAAERAFSATSVEQGVRDAFLKFMAEDGIVFRPQPVKAHEWYRDRPPAAGTLEWEPAYVEISSCGTMGLSTGPFEFRPAQEGANSVWGHFVSVWQRQEDGSWRVAIDYGNRHPAPKAKLKLQFRDRAAGGSPEKPGRYDERVAELLGADRMFGARSSEAGTVEAYVEVGAGDLRIYRDGRYPTAGRKASRKLLRETDPAPGWEPTGADVSRAGDLGYTYGTARHASEPPRANSYLRVWRRSADAGWRLVLEVGMPLPTEAE